jgi:hypothetical protein
MVAKRLKLNEKEGGTPPDFKATIAYMKDGCKLF